MEVIVMLTNKKDAIVILAYKVETIVIFDLQRGNYCHIWLTGVEVFVILTNSVSQVNVSHFAIIVK